MEKTDALQKQNISQSNYNLNYKNQFHPMQLLPQQNTANTPSYPPKWLLEQVYRDNPALPDSRIFHVSLALHPTPILLTPQQSSIKPSSIPKIALQPSFMHQKFIVQPRHRCLFTVDPQRTPSRRSQGRRHSKEPWPRRFPPPHLVSSWEQIIWFASGVSRV